MPLEIALVSIHNMSYTVSGRSLIVKFMFFVVPSSLNGQEEGGKQSSNFSPIIAIIVYWKCLSISQIARFPKFYS